MFICVLDMCFDYCMRVYSKCSKYRNCWRVFILKAGTGSAAFVGFIWLDPVVRQVSAPCCGAAWHWAPTGSDCCSTLMTSVVNGPDTWHIRRPRRSPSVRALLPAADRGFTPRTPRGVATVTAFCIFFFEWLLPLWSVQLMSETLAQAVSERFSGNVQTGRGNLDWGTARSAAADAVPEQQEQQQRRHGCDAKACQKKQRFKSRKGKVSSMHSTLCSFPAASNCILKLIWL